MRTEPNADGYYSDKVPCSKCPACRKRRAAQWVFRLQQQLKISTSAIFLTLTYNDECLPHVKHDGYVTDIPTLDYTHHTRFIKSLRKASIRSTLPLKYYAVGEYGEKYERPHFHYILFNLMEYELEDDFLSYIWKKGNISIDAVTTASIAYVTGYVNKKITTGYIKGDIRKPEKSFMSKGLGKDYLSKDILAYYQRKKIPYIHHTSGQKLPMPRYYKSKIYDVFELAHVNAEAKMYITENEPTENQQYEIAKQAFQKEARNKIHRSSKLKF